MIYCLEIMNTGDWSDCRYREYTRSKTRAHDFEYKVKRINFTDSSHGLVPFVVQIAPGSKRRPVVKILSDHVRQCLNSW